MRVLMSLALMAAALLSPAPPGYRLDPAASAVRAQVGVMGLASKTAHFPGMTGSIRVDPADSAAIDLKVDLDARMLSASDRTTRNRLKGEKFFWVDRYPTVSFRGSNLLMETDRAGRIEGTLTARGVTRPVVLDVTFDRALSRIDGRSPITIEARTRIDRRDFGMTSYALVVGKTVDIAISARMVPQG